jgi:hypothetical protein
VSFQSHLLLLLRLLTVGGGNNGQSKGSIKTLPKVMDRRSIAYIIKRYGHCTDKCYKLQTKKAKSLLSGQQQEGMELDVSHPRYFDPISVLVTKNYLKNNREALFRNNCQIKHKLATLIIKMEIIRT